MDTLDKMDSAVQQEEVYLRRLVPSDQDRLAEMANNKKIWDNVRDYFPYPYSKKDAERFIEFTSQEEPPMTFGIVFSGELAGVVGLVKRSDVHRKSAEIGYWIGEPYWNKGIAAKAVNLMVNYRFKQLNLIRIDTGVFEFNKASCRVLEKCGFELEGIFRNSVVKNGQVCNEHRYSILKEISR